MKMKIAVVGAGIAGLCATKFCLEYGYEVITYEKMKEVGGTWVYTDDVEKDELNIDVHTSMYQNLKTNFPKELMAYPDFEFTEPKHSYIWSSEMLSYIQSYATKFNVEPHIKFRHEVIRIRPVGTGTRTRWEIIIKDLINSTVKTDIFDAVFVCNGHFSCPRIPEYPSQNIYRGKLMHSHDYRHPDVFKGEKVLVVGSGASGVDIAYFTSKVSLKTTISFHDQTKPIPEGIFKKPDILAFTENGVEFQDGTCDDFTVVIFCTGYLYTFPFLNMDCGITVDDNYIYPLFMHCINIKYPTMCFIDLPGLQHPPQLSHLQVQLFLNYLSGKNPWPTECEMLEITNKDMESRWQKGFSKRQAHMLGIHLLGDYYNDISRLAGVTPPKPVMMAMYRENWSDMHRDHIRFRDFNFTVIDNENFIKTPI